MINQDGVWTRWFRYLTCLVLVVWLIMPLIPLAIWKTAINQRLPWTIGDAFGYRVKCSCCVYSHQF